MKKGKKKTHWGVFFWVLCMGLSFFSTVHGQTVRPAISSKPITSPTIDTGKNPRNKSTTPKISQGLIDLYKNYRARDQEGSGDPNGAGPRTPPSLPSSNEFVTIDAIASKDAGILKTDLEALGLKNAAVFGRLVSGIFPIAEIPKLANLKSLKFVRAALGKTHKRSSLLFEITSKATLGGAFIHDELRAAIVLFFSLLDERQRRIYAGLESLKLGHGGDQRIADVFNLDRGTVARGREELLTRDIEIEASIRKPGAGRKSHEKKPRRSSRGSKKS